jgi:hypothetical protein
METKTHYEQMSPAEQARIDARIAELERLIRERLEARGKISCLLRKQAE